MLPNPGQPTLVARVELARARRRRRSRAATVRPDPQAAGRVGARSTPSRCRRTCFAALRGGAARTGRRCASWRRRAAGRARDRRRNRGTPIAARRRAPA